MLITTEELRGKPVLAVGGYLGRVEDFLFDDKNWVIRYVVIRMGNWLSHRLLLLSPHVLIGLDAKADVLRVRLHKRQIEASPSPELQVPVSRRFEEEHYRYFGLPEYWAGSALWGRTSHPLLVPMADDPAAAKLHLHRQDKHLKSAHFLTGYKLQAPDGFVGHVTALWINDTSWEVRDMVIRAGPFYSSREVLIAPAKIERIAYEDKLVLTTLARDEISWTAARGCLQVQPRYTTPGFTQE